MPKNVAAQELAKLRWKDKTPEEKAEFGRYIRSFPPKLKRPKKKESA
jgi:hypothetical protein